MSMTFYARADVKIGAAGPFTGSNTTYGAQYWKGASQAVADVNAADGVKGEKIVLVQGDDACEPKQVVAVANRLVDEAKVSAVVGHSCSSSAMSVSEVYNEAGIPTIIPDSTNLQITECGMRDPFRIYGRNDQQGVIAADYMLDVLKAKKIAIIYNKDTYGQGLADTTRVTLVKRGIEKALYESLSRGEKGFNVLVTKIGALKPDAVYFDGRHPEAGPPVRQVCEQGMQTKFSSGDYIIIEELVTAVGEPQLTNGVLMASGQDPCTLPGGKAVIEKPRTSDSGPGGYTLYAYASTQAIVAARNAAGADNAEANNWLKSHDIDAVMGKEARGSKSDLKMSDYVVHQWDDKGKYHQF